MNRGHATRRMRAWGALAGIVTSFALCSQVLAQPHLKGRWDEPPPVDGNYSWPSGAMHCILLATGKVLYWYSPGCGTPETYAYLWDPTTGSQTLVPNTGIDAVRDCNAQSQLATGDLLVAGGGCGPNDSEAEQARVFRLAGSPNPWLQVPSMARERWYASSTTLQDGRVLITGGAEAYSELEGYDIVEYPEVYDPSLPMPWQSLISAVKPNMPLYAFTFLLPGGDVFFAGPAGVELPWPHAAILDTDTWTWTDVGSGDLDFEGALGSAVMYLPGKVLKVGGGEFCPTAVSGGAWIIDMTQASPTWVTIDSMNHARKDLNLVIGATGLVYAIGGQTTPCPQPPERCDLCVPVKWAESIDLSAPFPVWIELAQATIYRGYHSSALLLPSGKILSCGGESEPEEPGQPPPSISGEIFSPPYLFQAMPGDPAQSIDASRPPIGYAPTEIVYDMQFRVSIAQPMVHPISKVNLIRLGAVTHGFDMDQRFVPLNFIQTGFNLQISAPEDGSIAPPGHYMLFLVSAQGVPSEAAIIKVKHPPLP